MYINSLPKEQFDELLESSRTFILRGISLRSADIANLVIENSHKDSILWVPTYKQRKLFRKRLLVRKYSLCAPYAFLFLREFDFNIQGKFFDAGLKCYFLHSHNNVKNERPIGVSKEEMREMYEQIIKYIGSDIEEGQKILEKYQPGDLVMIMRGSFITCEGEVLEARGRSVIVEVPMFGKTVRADCDAEILEMQCSKRDREI